MYIATLQSLLCPNDLAVLLHRQYGLDQHCRVQLYRAGMSDVYWIHTSNKPYVVKIYHHGEEHWRRARVSSYALRLFRERGLPVPHLIANRNGEEITTIQSAEGDRALIVYEAVEGEVPNELHADHSYQFGISAARIHQAIESVKPHKDLRPINAHHLLQKAVHQLECYFPHRPEDIEFLRTFAENLWTDVERMLPETAPEFGFCHGDLHTGNAILTESGEIALFDFDSCGMGWRAIDLGTFYVSYDWLTLDLTTKKKRDDMLFYFLEGYTSVRTLSDNEMKVVDLCLPIRHFELLGIVLERCVRVEGIHWVTDTWLTEHVKWFKTWQTEYSIF